MDKVDPVTSARYAGCRYVDDQDPGIRRLRRGKSFRLVGPNGQPVSPAIRERVRSLVIPPAWENVWICPAENGHIQATGRDARGRKQYRYHPRFRAARDETKFGRLLDFAAILPKVRAAVDEDIARSGFDRDKVLATLVRLLELTLIRVGNEEYARANKSFGLTTLRTRHVDVSGSNVRFHFRGKSGKEHTLAVHDRRVARVVARCHDLPGEVLFQYVDDDGLRRTLESGDVNNYIRRVSGADFTAKEFRTWAATVDLALALRNLTAESDAEAKRNVVAAIKAVSTRLGNTPAVCRKCYVHPLVLETYFAGDLESRLTQAASKKRKDHPKLSDGENLVYSFLAADARANVPHARAA
jgi:DNA topoisomerase I